MFQNDLLIFRVCPKSVALKAPINEICDLEAVNSCISMPDLTNHSGPVVMGVLTRETSYSEGVSKLISCFIPMMS